MTEVSPTRPLLTRFYYFQWKDDFDEEKPYYLYIDPPKGLPVTNFSVASGPEEEVHDLRGIETKFNLDDHGFMVMQQQFPLEIINQHTVENLYLPSLEELIRTAVGQEAEICWFDWRTRSSNKAKTRFPKGTKIHLDDRSINLEPVKAVHVDQSFTAAINRVHRHAGDRAEELLKGRVRIINIWRPSGDPIESHPLAVMDGSKVPAEKLVEVDVVRHSYVGESYYPLQHDDYKWYFINNQTNEEVLLFKMYDSAEGVKAKCCPHASFQFATTSTSRSRESIEARALVYTPN
ncbi:putative 7 alpha-cephem-methoxylase [Dactylonectria macrodidyma]|uniref:7 alpha-cephem-methoxylase n=1 Tax=Dactylonectria macrodidyma TaxID=307937 RepID=A0A9P9EAU5_9HYPO|nr:putative 7 alpha-cephem-methoxylase [Dactylonectria macrodidyma]